MFIGRKLLFYGTILCIVLFVIDSTAIMANGS